MSGLRALGDEDEILLTSAERTWGGKVYCGKKKSISTNGFVEEYYDD
jgi:hypothetical protein